MSLSVTSSDVWRSRRLVGWLVGIKRHFQHNQAISYHRSMRYERIDKVWFSDCRLYDIRSNGAGLFFQPRSPHRAFEGHAYLANETLYLQASEAICLYTLRHRIIIFDRFPRVVSSLTFCASLAASSPKVQ